MNYRTVLFQEYSSTAQAPMIGVVENNYAIRELAFRKKFRDILPKSKEATILDIGCGMGFFLKFLQSSGFSNSVGIDLSPEQVDTAQTFGVKGARLCRWQDFLPEHIEKFDFIMLDNVIEHLTKDEIVELLKCMLASLKPGGKVYISTPNGGSPFGVPLAFIDFTHEVYFTAASLSQVLHACGFSSVYVAGEPLIGFDLRSYIRQMIFSFIKPFVKAGYVIGTGGGGRTAIPHIIEPSLVAIAYKPTI